MQLIVPPLSLGQLSALSVGATLPWTLAPVVEHGVIYSLSGSGWSGRFFAIPSVVVSVERRILVCLSSLSGIPPLTPAVKHQCQQREEFPMLRVNHATKLELSVVLGMLPLTVRELILLKAGDEFTLRVPLERSAMLMVGEEPFAEVRFERDGERILLRVESVL